jgi:hypothetical protein
MSFLITFFPFNHGQDCLLLTAARLRAENHLLPNDTTIATKKDLSRNWMLDLLSAIWTFLLFLRHLCFRFFFHIHPSSGTTPARCYFFLRFARGNLPRFFGPISFCSSVADPSGRGAEIALIRFRVSGTMRRIGSIPPSAANAANALKLFTLSCFPFVFHSASNPSM